MISGILIFNQKGENLIFRAFRSDCRPRLADIFRIQVISNPQVRSPILTLGSTTFSHTRHENIYLVAVTKSNANAALVFEFLERLRTLGKSYFNKFDEESVKNNFVLVYELLDGMTALGADWRHAHAVNRNPRFWIPSKHGDRIFENIHHNRRSEDGTENGILTIHAAPLPNMLINIYRRTCPRLPCKLQALNRGEERT